MLRGRQVVYCLLLPTPIKGGLKMVSDDKGKVFQLFLEDVDILVNKYGQHLSLVDILGGLDIAMFNLKMGYVLQSKSDVQNEEVEVKGKKLDVLKDATKQ